MIISLIFICQVVADVWGFVIGFPAEEKSVTLIWSSSEVQLIYLHIKDIFFLQMQRPIPSQGYKPSLPSMASQEAYTIM